MKQPKKFEFLGFKVTVNLTDEYINGDDRINTITSTDGSNIDVVFRSAVTLEEIVHESYQAFMYVLKSVDNKSHKFEELASEIYSYSFEEMFYQTYTAVSDLVSKRSKKSNLLILYRRGFNGYFNSCC